MISRFLVKFRLLCIWLVAILLPVVLGAEQLSPTLNAIFNQHEFEAKHFGPARWIDHGARYTTVEPSAAVSGGEDIVEYDTATGKRDVLVSAAKLLSAPGTTPMKIADYAWSSDNKRLLI